MESGQWLRRKGIRSRPLDGDLESHRSPGDERRNSEPEPSRNVVT
jgi:hypothetical protein